MKKELFSILLGVLSLSAFAQTQDPKSPGFDFANASADTSASAPMTDSAAIKEAIVKPYVRITLNVDSVTNLISYIGVVEQEESGSDSLYIRAKKWATKKFAGGTRSTFDLDKKNQKLVINGWLPAYAYSNKYTKRSIGKYEFKLVLWIKEGRYKYQISNFVHEGIKSNEGNTMRNYFEFYYTSTTNIKGNDQTLRFADRDINDLIKQMKKNLKDPVIVDEEEW